MRLSIIGAGNMGGAVARALADGPYFNASDITCTARSCETLLNLGRDFQTTTDNLQAVRTADIVIFALYPHIFVDWIKENQKFFKGGAILTDVTGVKGCIVEKIQDTLRDDVEFIAAHPMAGKEVSGVENSDDGIFKNANYIVVPTDKNTPEAIELCKNLGEILGFKQVAELSVAEHDKMIAFLSQLTHCLAVSLMCCNDTPGLEAYTGDSFRDLTRIARINDEMWSELFLSNREPLLEEMERFKATFDELYEKIKTGDRDGMRKMMRISTERRKLFDKR